MNFDNAINEFNKTGICSLNNFFDEKKISNLYESLLELRKINSDLFLNEKEYKKIKYQEYLYNKYLKFFVFLKKKMFPKTKHPEPFRKGKNILNNLNIDFIEKNENFVNLCQKILGKNYKILLKKVVISVGEHQLPEYVKPILKFATIRVLSDFIKEEFQDVTYFNGIDFHQDYLDFYKKKTDFITAYLYLNDVDETMAPLTVIENSHKLLATTYPHNLIKDSEKTFSYYSNVSDEKLSNLNFKKLLNKSNSLFFWTAYTLHGTTMQTSLKNRYSLRFLISYDSQDSNLPINKLLLNLKKNKKLFPYLKNTRNKIIKQSSIENLI